MDGTEQLAAALDAGLPRIDGIDVEPARRLTGPGLVWDRPGAVLDLFFQDRDPDRVTALWDREARRMLDAVGWQAEQQTSRRFAGGVNLAISAPMDQLHSAVLVIRAIWHFCAAGLSDTAPMAFEWVVKELRHAMAAEANPALTALFDAAAAHDVDILSDDDAVSIGHGTGSRTWAVDQLPAPDAVPWTELHDVPTVFITGTNGKTTTTRLCAAIARAAGLTAGLTSTDLVQVGETILDTGDYSGPAGARMALRDPRVEIAFLEVARGGILRRGLPTSRARAAVVTNVARDHLGEYGVNTLSDLARTKFAVCRALAADGTAILNADDPQVLAQASTVEAAIWWFSRDAGSPRIIAAKRACQPCAYVSHEQMVVSDGTAEVFSIALADVPLTLSGSARHNVSNALAALCVSWSLGLPPQAIRTALMQFGTDSNDNPGRLNAFDHKGARIFVDYAHNSHSIAAVCEALAQVPSGRRFLLLSQPGDRSDADMHEATVTALRFHPDLIVVAEIEEYLRGRALDETPALMAAAATAAGIAPERILRAGSPPAGARLILDRLQPGDLALLLVLSERDSVFEVLRAR